MNWREALIPQDVELVNDLHNAAWPGLPWSVDEFMRDEESWPERARRGRFLFEDRVFVEWMDCYWQPSQGRFYIAVCTRPEDRHLEEEAFRFLMTQCPEPKEFKAVAFSVWPERADLLEKLGFKFLENQPFTRFDIPEEGEVPPCPYRLVTFAQLDAEGFDWKEKLYWAGKEMMEDIPSKHQLQASPWEEWIKEIEDEHFFNRSLMFAVMDGENIAAMTRLVRNQTHPTFATTGFTGTARAYRRQGLARTVKLFSFREAYRQGIRTVTTDNLENNPMYGINLALGFQPWYRMDMYHRVVD
jgi:mycothiol synthase